MFFISNWLYVSGPVICYQLSHVYETCKYEFCIPTHLNLPAHIVIPCSISTKTFGCISGKVTQSTFQGLKKDSNFKIILRRELGQAFYNYSSFPDSYLLHFSCLYKIAHIFLISFSSLSRIKHFYFNTP